MRNKGHNGYPVVDVRGTENNRQPRQEGPDRTRGASLRERQSLAKRRVKGFKGEPLYVSDFEKREQEQN